MIRFSVSRLNTAQANSAAGNEGVQERVGEAKLPPSGFP